MAVEHVLAMLAAGDTPEIILEGMVRTGRYTGMSGLLPQIGRILSHYLELKQ